MDLQTELEQSKNEAATLQERLRATEERKSTLLACTTKTDGDQGSASTVSLEQLEAKDKVIAKLCEELIYFSAGQCPVSSPTIDICGVVSPETEMFTFICINNDNTLVWRSLVFSSSYAVIAGFLLQVTLLNVTAVTVTSLLFKV